LALSISFGALVDFRASLLVLGLLTLENEGDGLDEAGLHDSVSFTPSLSIQLLSSMIDYREVNF